MNKTVLIVDDVELSREIIKNAVVLSGLNVLVKFSENAFDAMNKMNNTVYDLVIMDIMMPNGNGFELLNMMSEKKINSKVIIISALDQSIVSSTNMLGELYELSIVTSLKKPVVSDQMSGLVHKVLTQEASAPTQSNIDSYALAISDSFPINLVYQPQVIANKRAIVGFEVLSRWSDNDGSLLPPSYFLPVIEELGKQKLFTKIVIKKFVEDYHLHFSESDSSLRFSINVNPNLLIDQSIIDDLFEIYIQGIRHTIVIELTERILSADVDDEALLANILRLKMKGFEISMDDFGIEASNVERLVTFPFNEVKIDRELTSGLSYNIEYFKRVEEVKKLASVKNIRIIYEGVEDEDTCAYLQAFDGFNQQGYLHGVPSLPEIAVEMLSRQKVEVSS